LLQIISFMATKKDSGLNLHQIQYIAHVKIIHAKDVNQYIGTVHNRDLGIVIITEDKNNADRFVNQAIDLHCAMSSLENIDRALMLSNKVPAKNRPSANILIHAGR
jgi:hypothetical protein